jgi:hypothetical protein
MVDGPVKAGVPRHRKFHPQGFPQAVAIYRSVFSKESVKAIMHVLRDAFSSTRHAETVLIPAVG